jgi:toxin CptA
MAEKLSLHLGPSRLLGVLLGSAHVLAAGAVWLAPLPVGCALAASGAFAAHLAWVLRRHAFRSDAGASIELELLDDCSVSVYSRAGVSRAYRIAGSSFVSPLLTVLNLRTGIGHGARTVLIASDSLDADSFRRLRVWLRWRWRDRSSIPAFPAS